MADAALEIVEVDEAPLERQALDDANGDPARAVEILTERVLADRVLLEQSLPELARGWAYQKIHGLLSVQRRSIIRAVGSGDNFSSALNTAMSNELVRLMDMPVPFIGKRMADATPDELRESADRCSLLAKDYSRKARWQCAVADAVDKKGGGMIGKKLKENDLARLWSEADAS